MDDYVDKLYGETSESRIGVYRLLLTCYIAVYYVLV